MRVSFRMTPPEAVFVIPGFPGEYWVRDGILAIPVKKEYGEWVIDVSRIRKKILKDRTVSIKEPMPKVLTNEDYLALKHDRKEGKK